MAVLTFLTIIYTIIGIVTGLIVLFSYMPKIRNIISKYKYSSKIISISKFVIMLIGIISIVLVGFGKLSFVEENNADKIQSLTDPSCLENSNIDETIDFEWIIESEEEFESRIAYFVIPFSSGDFNDMPLFEKNWDEVKIEIGRTTIKNKINYSNSQKGRYRICAQIVNKLEGEEILETNCCTKTIRNDLD